MNTVNGWRGLALAIALAGCSRTGALSIDPAFEGAEGSPDAEWEDAAATVDAGEQTRADATIRDAIADATTDVAREDTSTSDAAAHEDAVVDDATIVDECPSEWVSASPGRGAVNVSPTANFEMTFAPGARWGSVMIFAPHARDPMPAAVTRDGSHVTLDPIWALEPGAVYRVVVRGLESDRCAVIDDYQWTVRTTASPTFRSETYDFSGEIDNGNLYETDARGRVLVVRHYSSVGSDGRFGTADDVGGATQHYGYVDRPDGVVTHLFYGRGADLMLATEDDTIDSVAELIDDPSSSSVLWLDRTAGPDAVFSTEDDGYSGVYRTTFRRDGVRVEQESFASVGPDGQPLTSDDVLTSGTRSDADGRVIVYQGAGEDGTFETLNYVDFFFDETGRVIGNASYLSGPDDVFFTDDDRMSSGYAATFDPITGLVSHGVQLSSLGADETWNTADDVVYVSETREYDARGSRTLSTSSYPGPDGVPFTADDRVFRRTYFAPIVE